MAFSNSIILVLISIPYAPVSSLVNHISRTLLLITYNILSIISLIGYDCKLPLECLVLQYVQLPKQPLLIGIISIYLFFLIFGNFKLGNDLLLSINLTILLFNVWYTTSVTLSICLTPIVD